MRYRFFFVGCVLPLREEKRGGREGGREGGRRGGRAARRKTVYVVSITHLGQIDHDLSSRCGRYIYIYIYIFITRRCEWWCRICVPYTLIKITHTPGNNFRPPFSFETWGGGTTKMAALETFRREGRVDACIAGRIRYALPVVEKPSSENRPRGCVVLSP